MRHVSIREPIGAGGDLWHFAQALAAHRFLFRAGLAAANIFAWIFLFQFFYILLGDVTQAFARAALLYTLTHLIVVLTTPLSARLLRFGARRGLVEATLLGASAFVLLGATLQGLWSTQYAGLGMMLFAVLLGSYRAFYWLPYESEAHEAHASGTSTIWKELLIALVPLAVGVALTLSTLTPGLMLFVAAGALVLSLVPLYGIRDVHERITWTYRGLFGEFAAPEHRDLVRSAIFEGVFGAALFFVWPLAVFLMLGWSYEILGLVLTLTFLVAILARGKVRKTLRRLNVHRSSMLTGLLVVAPWVLRLSVASPLAIIFTDSYFYTTTPKRLGLDPLTFEQAGDAGYFLDEYTALKEMGLALGRAALAAFAVGLALILSLPAAFFGAFVIAALLSLWSAR